MKHLIGMTFAAALAAGAGALQAAPLVINNFGVSGWNSLDTRNTGGTNLVQPGDAAAIAAQINANATVAPALVGGSLNAGRALSLDGTTSNSGKSSFGLHGAGVGGLASIASLGTSFSASYRWATTSTLSSGRTSPFKISIDTIATGSAPSTPRTGEDQWDYILVHVPVGSSSAKDTWHDESMDYDSGRWNIFRSGYLGGGPFCTNGNFGGSGCTAAALTLEDMWTNTDPLLDTVLDAMFASTSVVRGIEFGIGSSQRNALNYVESLQTSIYNGGDIVRFGGTQATVPEPGTVLLALVALGGLVASRRRRRAD